MRAVSKLSFTQCQQNTNKHILTHTQTQAEYWSMRKVRPDSFQMSTIALGSACAIVPNYDNDSKELHIPVPLMVLLLCILEPAEPLIRYQSHQWLQFGPPVGSWIQPVQLRGIQKSTPSLLPTLAHFSPEEGGHQDKQSVLMTDPCQTEDNYGNGVLKDTVSLKPIVSTPTTTDSFPAACSCCEVCVCVCVLCEYQAGPVFLNVSCVLV